MLARKDKKRVYKQQLYYMLPGKCDDLSTFTVSFHPLTHRDVSMDDLQINLKDCSIFSHNDKMVVSFS